MKTKEWISELDEMVTNFRASEKLLAAQYRIKSIKLGISWKLQINKNETDTKNMAHGFDSRTDLRL
jgi:predicted FMN-binding regulatory protein PaiB